MEKILIIKLGALGDVVMATSLIQQIQKHHSLEQSWLLTATPFDRLFENWKDLKTLSFNRKGFKDNLRILVWIRKQKFGRLYDLQSNDRTGILCALSGVPERVGNHPHYPYNIHPKDKYEGQCHIYERMLSVLECAGITPKHEIPFLPASEEEKRYIRDWMTSKNLVGKKFILIHAGCSIKHPEKRWPHFQELAVTLSESGYTIIWAGSESDIALNKQLSSSVGIDATGMFSLTALAELGRHSKFAVTNDSGPMHILSGSGIPVYALFGPTNWRRCHAIGQVNNVIAADMISDSPGVNSEKADIKKIKVDIVLNRLYQDGHISKKYETKN